MHFEKSDFLSPNVPVYIPAGFAGNEYNAEGLIVQFYDEQDPRIGNLESLYRNI
jgi:hypothetical protein